MFAEGHRSLSVQLLLSEMRGGLVDEQNKSAEIRDTRHLRDRGRSVSPRGCEDTHGLCEHALFSSGLLD